MEAISGVIITLNEEKNIREAIASLQEICTEIIVLDSGSVDRTCEIAESMGAKVYAQEYLGDGFQKNRAVELASHNWVFSLDADERLTPELVQHVKSLDLSKMTVDGMAVRRRNMIGSRWMKCCGWYPDYLVRFFNKKQLRFADTKQHAFVPEVNTERIKFDIIHFTYQNIGELFAKPGRNFSTRAAKIMYLSGKKVSVFSPFIHGFWAFFTNYFFRKGIWYGVDGFSLSLAISCNTYLKYAKLLEYQRDPKVRETENFERIW
ncbi:glycosyltransferase family 2 protein [Bacteroidales bacterium OttesenSCG-928-B11]|nr:glycosyltransferase family 2 protein [Bacteroidales bacterium OttesenSCG-928-E04]MDL2308193.1 glycosyltransferase family 2 protein [Bacteroidales bacterium OttesenSCG-928-C03]MDL2312592.1 glycosyltransferase family 2 protein [Bacteroidales bacterium OttesenSCG-928-B11]MDL2325632.1 glycosyltransferase family 2 protein [Bacteroidales bacterium OttesenSCG-928-A14]